MAELTFPWEMFLQAQQMKNQNKQNMYGDIAGIGQGLGQGLGAVGDVMQQRKRVQQKKAWSQTINQMMNDPNTPPELKTMLPMIAQNPDLAGQMGTEAMKLSAPPNALQQSQIDRNKALTARLGQPPQAKPVDPLDEAIKQKRLELMGLMAKRFATAQQPKPPNPVPAAALDVRTQIANAQNRSPWQKWFGKSPVITNPLKGKTVPASSTSDMSDEELMRLATQDDSQ
jgi:hypothetical protein